MCIWLIYLLPCQLLTKYTKSNAHKVSYSCISCATEVHNLAPHTEGQSQAEDDITTGYRGGYLGLRGRTGQRRGQHNNNNNNNNNNKSQGTTENSHIGHCTHTSESTNVKIQ